MTARPQSPEPGMYHIPNEIPDLGVSGGDFLYISPAGEEAHMLTRLLNKQVVDIILSSPGVTLVQPNTPQPSVPGCEPFAVDKDHGTKADEIDVDALLAGAGTVREPSAEKLLWRIAQGDGSTRIESVYEAALKPWHRYHRWRENPGHRQICPKCNHMFIRDRRNGRRCPDCRMKFKRTCADCGEQFLAAHYMLKRCPPCRAKHQGVRCDTCGQKFTPYNSRQARCDVCRLGAP